MLLLLAALSGLPPAKATARTPAGPLPRGSRILVVNAALAPAALDELAGARGWEVVSAPGPGPAIVAARAGKPRLLVVSAGLLDAPRLAALRAAAPGAKLILTRQEGEALPELPEQAVFEVLPAPYEPAALEAAVARAFAPRGPPSGEEKRRLLEARATQKVRKERARRIAALTVDRILAMAEPLESEGAALAQLLERLRRKDASSPERLSGPERDLLLASSALELGLDGLASRPEGDRARGAAQALRRAGFEAEAAALEEGMHLLSRRGRLGRVVDRLQALQALDGEERARWAQLSAALEGARPGGPRRLLEYARAQRKALRLDRSPAPAAQM